MGAFDEILALVSSKTANLSPILPFAPIQPISNLVSHLAAAPVITGFPVARLGALHAARVATVWAGMTKAKRQARSKKVGLMGDLFGYLALCWGGGTIVPLLIGQPPSWLLTSTPWLTYVPIYLLLVPTTLGEYIHSTCPPILFNLAGSIIDAITRGSTVCAIPSALAAAGIPATAWTTAILGGIACTGGGIFVQIMGLHEEDWKLGMPNLLKGGVLNTLDFWGGMMAALLYSAALRLTPEVSLISDLLARTLPSELVLQSSPIPPSGPVVTREVARGAVVLFLAALFLARVITLMLLSPRPALGKAKKMDKVDKEIAEAVLHEKVGAGALGPEVQTTTRTTRSRSGTPKKSPKLKSS